LIVRFNDAISEPTLTGVSVMAVRSDLLARLIVDAKRPMRREEVLEVHFRQPLVGFVDTILRHEQGVGGARQRPQVAPMNLVPQVIVAVVRVTLTNFWAND
jgi:hypothetical protein